MSIEFKDYYEILGVPEDADAEAIKKAYRRLARRLHPDINKEADAERKFSDLAEAYEVLGSTDKRQEYDQLRRHGWHGGERWDAPPGWRSQGWSGRAQAGEAAGEAGGEAGGERAQAFSDFFQNLFGNSAAAPDRGGMPRRGRDRHARLAVALEESFQGAKKTIQLDLPRRDASGRLRWQTRTLEVTIPKGITEGETIRLRGQGEPNGDEGQAGDLYLEVGLIPHPYFVPHGRDIHLTLPVAPWEAALGTEVTVPTLGGNARLRVPAGSANGERLRLRNQGLPGNPAGHQIIELRIIMPPAPDAEQRRLWQSLADSTTFDPRAQWHAQ